MQQRHRLVPLTPSYLHASRSMCHCCWLFWRMSRCAQTPVMHNTHAAEAQIPAAGMWHTGRYYGRTILVDARGIRQMDMFGMGVLPVGKCQLKHMLAACHHPVVSDFGREMFGWLTFTPHEETCMPCTLCTCRGYLQYVFIVGEHLVACCRWASVTSMCATTQCSF